MYSESIQKEIGSSDADMSGTGDIMTFTPSVPVEIVGFGYIVTTVVVDAADGLVLKADKRPSAGSDTDRGDGDVGTLTLTATEASAQGVGDVFESRPKSPITVNPGEQVMLEVTTAPDSGAALPFINYRHKPTSDRSVHTVVNT